MINAGDTVPPLTNCAPHQVPPVYVPTYMCVPLCDRWPEVEAGYDFRRWKRKGREVNSPFLLLLCCGTQPHSLSRAKEEEEEELLPSLPPSLPHLYHLAQLLQLEE